ncbi:hypothetical protein LRS13_15900 [Svornostia abyssi]|uniref:DUF2470 domain-containing protein n=1 Tax=Svornostia abyssi TaxID=2898438 RepID=A0ABY5PC39_9ACTN|nr:hypothetical protein LRS13_15900 [Parviterribacteraceae bacterium J379]
MTTPFERLLRVAETHPHELTDVGVALDDAGGLTLTVRYCGLPVAAPLTPGHEDEAARFVIAQILERFDRKEAHR